MCLDYFHENVDNLLNIKFFCFLLSLCSKVSLLKREKVSKSVFFLNVLWLSIIAINNNRNNNISNYNNNSIKILLFVFIV